MRCRCGEELFYTIIAEYLYYKIWGGKFYQTSLFEKKFWVKVSKLYKNLLPNLALFVKTY